jgi:hypothetical protein
MLRIVLSQTHGCQREFYIASTATTSTPTTKYYHHDKQSTFSAHHWAPGSLSVGSDQVPTQAGTR